MFLACSVQELLYMSRQAVGFLVLTIIVIIAFLKLVFGWALKVFVEMLHRVFSLSLCILPSFCVDFYVNVMLKL